jgi:isochorismate hydrolase
VKNWRAVLDGGRLLLPPAGERFKTPGFTGCSFRTAKAKRAKAWAGSKQRGVPSSMKRSPAADLISRHDAVLLVVDVQERLMPVIAEATKVVDNIVRLLRFARIVGLPVVVTEQQKLGPTVPEIRAEVPGLSPILKTTFDCAGCPEYVTRFAEIGRNTLIVVGVEAHICVAQTVLGALREHAVHLVSDATSSRSPHNRSVAIERMRSAGATITSTEMLIYEIMREAGTDEFRAVLPLVK